MRRKRMKRVLRGMGLVALAFILAGCATPENYSDWRWQQYNPNYRPLPGYDR